MILRPKGRCLHFRKVFVFGGSFSEKMDHFSPIYRIIFSWANGSFTPQYTICVYRVFVYIVDNYFVEGYIYEK